MQTQANEKSISRLSNTVEIATTVNIVTETNIVYITDYRYICGIRASAEASPLQPHYTGKPPNDTIGCLLVPKRRHMLAGGKRIATPRSKVTTNTSSPEGRHRSNSKIHMTVYLDAAISAQWHSAGSLRNLHIV